MSSNNFNFNTFNTYLDQWLPGLNIDLKYEMYVPLCTTSVDNNFI